VAHTSFYRTYRPATFADMVGQKHIERTLKNAVATDQVAHAYLFSGPRGTGKTTTARILAAALLCEHPKDGEPDGSCEQCQEVENGTHPDVMELDAASRTGVDNVRDEIIARVQFAPVRGRSKIYIIDEVHMLSTGAFNAFLKTLEEPPDHVVFILCTTDPQKVPETIRSRCQQFEFRPYAVEELTEQLKRIGKAEKIKAEPEALALIAARARGGMRDAITAFEQMAAFTDDNITAAAVEETLGGADAASLAALVRIVATADTPACFTWVAGQVNKGADLPEVVHALIEYVRDLYVLQVLGAQPGVIDRSVAEQARMTELLALLTGPEQVARMLDLLAELSAALRWANEPRTLLELALVRMTRPESDLSVAALSQRLEALEAGIPSDHSRHSGLRAAISASEIPGQARDDVDNEASGQARDDVDNEASGQARDDVGSEIPGQAQDDVGNTEAGRLWREVLAQIKKTRPSRYATFAAGELEADPQGGYILSFAPNARFQLASAKESDNVALLNKASEEACGQALNPRYMVREEPHLPGMPEPEIMIDDIPEEGMFTIAGDEPPVNEDGCGCSADLEADLGEAGEAEQPVIADESLDEPEFDSDEAQEDEGPVAALETAQSVAPEPSQPLPTPSLQQTPPPTMATVVAPSKDTSAIFADLGALPITEAPTSVASADDTAPEPEMFGFDSLLADEYEGASADEAAYSDDPDDSDVPD